MIYHLYHHFTFIVLILEIRVFNMYWVEDKYQNYNYFNHFEYGCNRTGAFLLYNGIKRFGICDGLKKIKPFFSVALFIT